MIIFTWRYSGVYVFEGRIEGYNNGAIWGIVLPNCFLLSSHHPFPYVVPNSYMSVLILGFLCFISCLFLPPTPPRNLTKPLPRTANHPKSQPRDRGQTRPRQGAGPYSCLSRRRRASPASTDPLPSAQGPDITVHQVETLPISRDHQPHSHSLRISPQTTVWAVCSAPHRPSKPLPCRPSTSPGCQIRIRRR